MFEVVVALEDTGKLAVTEVAHFFPLNNSNRLIAWKCSLSTLEKQHKGILYMLFLKEFPAQK